MEAEIALTMLMDAIDERLRGPLWGGVEPLVCASAIATHKAYEIYAELGERQVILWVGEETLVSTVPELSARKVEEALRDRREEIRL